MSLHNDIMNIKIGGNGVSIASEALTDSGGVHIAYKIGHRDARHAAAELANKYDYNHERLVEALQNTLRVLDGEDGTYSINRDRKLLAQIQSEKGGKL